VHRRTSSLVEQATVHKAKTRQKSTHARNTSLGGAHCAVEQYAHRTKKGYIPGNPHKVNQDSLIAQVGFAGHSDMSLFSVCDGHGTYGHDVSRFVKEFLPELLARDSNLSTSPSSSLTKATLMCHQELSEGRIDVTFSGTTMTLVLIKGTRLWCANVGDSRSLLARLSSHEDGSSSRHWTSIALSRDHKPDDQDEFARIVARGGRVEAYQGKL
jgi:serine/threonine protein phosphatase PrpC